MQVWHHHYWVTWCCNTVNDNIESHQDRWWKLPPIKQRTVESLINNPTPFSPSLSSGQGFLITIICSLLMISKYQYTTIHNIFCYNLIIILSQTHTYTSHYFTVTKCSRKNFCKIQNSFFSKSLRYPNFLKTNSLNAFSPFRRIKNSC